MKKKTVILFFAISSLWIISSCSEQHADTSQEKPLVTVKTVPVMQGDIESIISLNGKTIYLKKNTIVSPISGYVSKMNIKFGEKVQKNEVLFVLQTKEHKALENTAAFNKKAGIINVTAPSDGVINELKINAVGGYVMEGSLLCSVVENKDMMVQVNAPFEYNSLIKKGIKCKMQLADQTSVKGTVFRILPIVDEADQTQSILIKPDDSRQLPENLNLSVQFINEMHSNALLIAKAAVMTNETQTEFWLMKIWNDSIAVKIPIVKGIQNDSMVEILSADLNKQDLIISEGAYGLPDSTVVKIVK